MEETKELPPREHYERYEKVRASGRWNMLTHSMQAARAARLHLDQYMAVLSNYDACREAYGDDRK